MITDVGQRSYAMSMKVFFLALILLCAVTPISKPDLASAQRRQKTQRKTARYACPMHPEVKSSKPGKCPKCGMTLRLIPDAAEANSTPAASAPAKDAPDSFSFSSSRI